MEFSDFFSYLIPWFISSTAWEIFQKQESVQFIYILLFLDLFIMTFLAIRIFFVRFFLKSNELAENQFHRNFLLMELLINFPVTLGVIGTLISISIAVTQAEGGNLSDVMNNNFDAAVITTVIGGLVYGYCFLLQAVLHRYLYSSKPQNNN
jgi:hypothetical protein